MRSWWKHPGRLTWQHSLCVPDALSSGVGAPRPQAPRSRRRALTVLGDPPPTLQAVRSPRPHFTSGHVRQGADVAREAAAPPKPEAYFSPRPTSLHCPGPDLGPGHGQSQTHTFILCKCKCLGRKRGLARPSHSVLWTNEIEMNLLEGAPNLINQVSGEFIEACCRGQCLTPRFPPRPQPRPSEQPREGPRGAGPVLGAGQAHGGAGASRPTLKPQMSFTCRQRLRSSLATRTPSRVRESPGVRLPSGAAT